ncbi:MAG: OstA-like protein [Bacteroidia bacterium]|nr:OstA-like protein [Bacteroidia bacterium]
MVRKVQEAIKLAFAFAALLAPLFARAQTEQKDSLVRLIQASSLELKEVNGNSVRKAYDATFLHNGTFLICDSALWNVDTKIINCEGHVQLLQDETELTSDRLDYFIDEDLAQFRGSIVQLRNKKENVLRTRNLDYNTKDSVAMFVGGGAMRDADGQIIESDRGTYESTIKLFTFNGNVNMFTDSVFVKTTSMKYDSDRSFADFITYIDFWKEGNMLSGNKGWYNRNTETFFFRDKVHALTEDKEVWCDTLYYYRNTNDAILRGHAQVQDTTRNTFAIADHIFYQDSISRATLRKRAAVAIKTEQDGKVDTLYCGADTLVHQSVKRCDIPDYIVADAVARLEEIMADPVSSYRRKAAEDAARAAEAAKAEKMKGANPRGRNAAGQKSQAEPAAVPEAPAADTLSAPADSLPVPAGTFDAVADTLAAPADTVAAPAPDTTKIGFVHGRGHVKMFRKDLQLSCDSLYYSDLDSIARFFIDPIIWNEGNRQYTSDSLFVLVKSGGVDRASLMSNAFILTQEAENYYDQIKGTDVMAFFDSTSALRRFDALGGATALFYLQENDEFATVNKVESKMLSALLKDGSVEKVYYFDSPKNDAYPIAQLPQKESRMRGFNWMPEKRPKGKDDITTLTIRPSERRAYESRPHATFVQADIYFPGYMDDVYKSLEEAKRRAELRREREAAARDSIVAANTVSDSLDAQPVIQDSVAVDSVATDTLAVTMPAADTVSVAPRELTPKELKEIERRKKKEEAELARQMRIAARDAKWAELDARDAAKAEARALKKQKRDEARAERLRKRREKQAVADQKKLEKFVEYYQKQKERNERNQKPKAD